MITLSLAQPYASLLITGAKRFETRSWKPGLRNMAIIQREGLLIHASLSKKYVHLQATEPFWGYLSKLGPLSYGAIIGQCRVGQIMRTEQWIRDYATYGGCMNDLFSQREIAFGDFSPGRFAWEILDPIKFDQPIPAKGALSLWNYPKPIKYAIPDLSLSR